MTYILSAIIAVLSFLVYFVYQRGQQSVQKVRDEAAEQYQSLEDSIEPLIAERIKLSKSVSKGLVAEQIVPFWPDFPYNPADVKFLGQPIDLVVFDGMASGNIEQISIVEVKTGRARLSAREKNIKKVIEEGKVNFEIYRPKIDEKND